MIKRVNYQQLLCRELSQDLLNTLYEKAKEKTAESNQRVLELEENLQSSEQMKESLFEQFGDILSWSDMYNTCDMETKKMILARLFGAVRVKRNYEVEIDLTASCEQLGLCLDEFAQEEAAADKRKTA
jgi:hypothetical protein